VEREWLEFFVGILLPAGGYVAEFTKSSGRLVAYFDESRGGGRLPLTSVAGYLLEPRAYLDFDKDMQKLLRDSKMCYFQMQDCLHLDGYFKKFRGTDSNVPIGASPEERSRISLKPAVHRQKKMQTLRWTLFLSTQSF
jgi:hypothetical protein